MASGHGVPKPNTANHPGRKVGRAEMAGGYTNLVSGVTHTIDTQGYEVASQQPFVDSLGSPTPQHARAMERIDRSALESYQKLRR